jgi:hypothetical protein
MVSPPAPPMPLAMVICDAVWRDPATGKYFLLGCFSAIGAHSFPTVHPSLAVYLALTDGYGALPLILRLVDAETRTIHEARVEVDFTDPRAILEIGLNLQHLAFGAAGEYRLQLHAGDTFVLERRLMVHDLRATRA